MTPKDIIHDIREKKYGIGPDGHQREDFKAISSDLKSAIEQLSTGLYGEDIHFILELIQNAEDNDYAENVLPDLRFVLLDQDPMDTPGSNGCLCLLNNEKGFSERNIRSICATGQSTKAKASGYIGEKGIGFKSVFTASDEPHIISNGYQFKFKGLGLDPNIELAYVVPYWVDQLPSVAREDGYTTCLLLPIKEKQRQNIEQELRRIKPETILFLSKLENLAIELRDAGKTVNLIRDVTTAPKVDLLVNIDGSGESIRNYWLAKKTLQVPPDIHEAKREGITEREISVAFPLTPDRCNGTLYAFLPTEIESGLPFLINADFLLTANRESIQINKEWNLWLRDSIAGVVVEGLGSISGDKEYQHLICRYVPVKKNLKALDDFLSPVCDEICRKLKEMPLVLASTGELIKPELARVVTKEERAVLQSCTDQTTFNRFKLIDSRLDHLTDQLRAVGVRELSVGDIKACLSDDAWLAQQNGQWFFELYSFLQKSSKLSKTSYTGLRLIKLANGLVKVGGDTVYLPAVDALAVASISTFTDVGLPGVCFIDQELYELLTSKSDVLHWCRQNLGWINFSYSGYLINTILPYLNERVAELSSEQLLTASSGFIQIWSELSDDKKEEVKEKLPLLLDSGEIVTRDSAGSDEFVVPRAYDKKTGWQLIFVNEEDYSHLCVLSDEYVSSSSTVDKSEIDLFFNEMKVSSHPSLKIFTVSRGERLEAYQVYLDQEWRLFDKRYTNTPVLHTRFPPLSFLSKQKRDEKQYRGAFLKWLESDIWKRPFGLTSSFSEKSKIKYFYYTDYSKPVRSGVDYYLKNTAWIKTSNGDKRPAEVFVKKQSIVDMFGDSLPYLEDSMSIELCQLLGIKTDITNETVMQSLEVLSNSSDPNKESIKKFYKYLNEYGSDFVESFNNDSIIYVPCISKWLKPSEVVWDDESAVLGNLYGWLSTDYEQSGLRDFFVKKLGVKSSVDVEALADAWLALQNRNDLEVKEVEIRLSKIVPKLLSLVKSGNPLPDWWGKFQNEVMFWTQDDEFSDKDEVYYSDNHYLSRLFSDDINLTWIPDAGNPVSYYAPLFDELGVKAISEAVTHHCVIGGSISPISPKLLTEHSKRLLAYLVKNENPDEFEQWLAGGEIGIILRTVEAEVLNIDICYEISDWGIEKSVSDKNGFLDLDRQIVFRSDGSDNEEVKDDIAEFIARAIWGTRYRDKEDKVKSILGVTSEARFRKLRDKKDWAMSRELMAHVDKCISQSAAVQESADGGVEEEASPPNLDDRNPSQLGGSTGSPGVRGEDPGRVPHTVLRQGGASVPQLPRGNTNSGTSNSGGAGSRTNMYSPGSNSGGGRQTTGENGGGRSRSREQTQRINAQNQRRIVTYVYPELANSDKDELDQDQQRELQQERHDIGEAAENFVIQYEQNAGWEARRMPTNNPGYDIESVNNVTGEARFIEVKGVDGAWGDRGVGLSSTQYQEALNKSDDYWLYVVEHARSDKPIVYRVRNPAKLIGEYRFDSGWRFLAIDNEPVASSADTYECLSDYTDDAGCKKIIDSCLSIDIPAPDVGYELVDEAGEVMAEFELAWEYVNICVVTSDQIDLQACDGWDIFSSSETDSVLACLTKAYGQSLGEY